MLPKLLRAARLSADAALGEPRARHRARWILLDALTRRLGFRLYALDSSWFRDESVVGLWREFPGARRTPLGERHYNLYHLARAIRSIPGDLAECGVYEGAASFFIMRANTGTGKHHHGFDSFAGLSSPTTVDVPAAPRSGGWQRGDLAVGREVAARNLAEFAAVTLYEGFIPERFAEVADRRFSFVHIDVDLHQPTAASLAFFYERVNPGGMIVCDDYGHLNCPGARRAVDDWMRDRPEEVVILTTGQAVIIKQASEP